MRIRDLTSLAFLGLLVACSNSPKDIETSSDTSGFSSSSAAEEQLPEIIDPLQGTEVFESVSIDGPRQGSQQDLVVNVGDRIFFGYDRFDLTPEAQAQLEVQAQWLQQHSNVSITIKGHTDERGTREYNLGLGERRANSVKNYLVALGVSPNRISTISFGKEQPAVLGSNPSSWAQNRRAVTEVN